MLPGQLGRALQAVMIRLSPVFHDLTRSRYWSTGKDTHSDMSSSRFDFYASQLAGLIGPLDQNRFVLDHGAGAGEIGTRLKAYGYTVEASEFFDAYMRRIAALGLPVYHGARLPEGRFDAIVANNSMFYIHPRRLNDEVQRLLRSLRPSGRLLITDVPVLEKLDAVTSSKAKQLFARLTRVYQPELGGFFISLARMRMAFPSMRSLDSWNNYRAHIIIERSSGRGETGSV